MSELLTLLAFTAFFFIVKRFLAMRREHQLRSNPPERRIIEVCLPRGISDSNKRMMKFYRKVSNAALADDKARRVGMRQLDIIYLAEVGEGRTMPDIRFLVYADPDKMDQVKRSLKQVFDGMADVVELDEDPMKAIASELRPPEKQAAPDGMPAPEELAALAQAQADAQAAAEDDGETDSHLEEEAA